MIDDAPEAPRRPLLRGGGAARTTDRPLDGRPVPTAAVVDSVPTPAVVDSVPTPGVGDRVPTPADTATSRPEGEHVHAA